MKNLFFISLFLCASVINAGRVQAQKALRFIDGIELNDERNGGPQSMITPLPVASVNADVNNSSTENCTKLQFKYAQLIETDVESIRNTRLYNFIEEWYNTRYRMGGTTKKGIDCSAFSSQLLDAVYGQCLPRTASEQYHSTYRIDEGELKEGDLVFYNTRGGISHVGVYLANGYFVHASSSNGVIISSMADPYYSKRFRGAGRMSHDIANTGY